MTELIKHLKTLEEYRENLADQHEHLQGQFDAIRAALSVIAATDAILAELMQENVALRSLVSAETPIAGSDLVTSFQEDVKVSRDLGKELNQATETIERQQRMINELQEEVRRLEFLKVENLGSGDIAYRLVTSALHEETKKRFAKTKANTIRFTLKRDYTMTVGGTGYQVSIRKIEKPSSS